jgi:transposase
MKAYSEDLRKKILQAVDRGMTKSEAARTFGVSRSSVKRYAAARREGKPLTPKKHPGSKSQARMREGQEDPPSRRRTEARHHPQTEIPFLKEMVGVSVSESTLSRLLRKMGFVPRDGVWVRARGTNS